MTTMKILEGTTDAANQSYYAAEGLKALGYDARCAHYTSCEYFLEGDFEFGFDRAKRVRYPLYALSLIHIFSQRGRDYTQPEFIRSLAHVRGVQIGVPYAEVFEAPRIVL